MLEEMAYSAYVPQDGTMLTALHSYMDGRYNSLALFLLIKTLSGVAKPVYLSDQRNLVDIAILCLLSTPH